MRKTLAVIAAMIGGTAAVVIFGLWSLQRMTPDAPRHDDSDLRPAAAAFPGPDDAYHDFVKMGAKMQLTKEERELTTKQDESPAPDLNVVEPLIAKNAVTMAAFAAFQRRPRFTDPSYIDPSKVSYETPVPQYFPVVSAAHLASLHAAILLKEGRAPEALEEALGIMEAGQVMLRSEQPLIGALVGMLLEDIGARRARDVIASGRLDKPRLLNAARRLSAHRGAAAALQASFRFEYLNASYMVDHMPEYAAKGPEGRWYLKLAAHSLSLYQPERTRALYAGRYRALVEEAGKPCLKASFAQEFVPVTKRNSVGTLMFNLEIPRYDKLFAKRCESDFRSASVAAAAAVEAYRLDRKRRPASLGELVPDYLAAIPADPATGEPLLYAPETGEVHSAGKDAEGKPL